MTTLKEDNASISQAVSDLADAIHKARKAGTTKISSWQLILDTKGPDTYISSGGCICVHCRKRHAITAFDMANKQMQNDDRYPERVH